MLLIFNTRADLTGAPINPDWIVEGSPSARNRIVSGSSDRSAWTMLWDCTAGQFQWVYKVDETVHVLEGEVTITANGKSKTLRAGDLAFFPAGTVAHWHVENYVRKLAFCQKPMPALFGVPLRLARRIMAQFGKGMALVENSLSEPEAQACDEQMVPSRVRVRS